MNTGTEIIKPFLVELEFYRNTISELEAYRVPDEGLIILTKDEHRNLILKRDEVLESVDLKKTYLPSELLQKYAVDLNVIFFLNNQLCQLLEECIFLDFYFP
jgi:hypothetical protein